MTKTRIDHRDLPNLKIVKMSRSFTERSYQKLRIVRLRAKDRKIEKRVERVHLFRYDFVQFI